jgi:hypothetical protein
MTAVMVAGRRYPPREVVARTGASLVPAWPLAHVAMGAVLGSAFALLRPLLPRSRVAAGLAYGAATWGIDYVGIAPALALYPPPGTDEPPRAVVNIASHAAYGVALAFLLARR